LFCKTPRVDSVIPCTVHHYTSKIVVAVLLVMFAFTASAALTTYKVAAGDTLSKIATRNTISLTKLVTYNPQIKNINLIYPGQIIYLTATASKTSTTPKPATSTPTVSKPTATTAANETRFTAFISGYGWPDNTPAGAAIALPSLHTKAGGTGTFSDPITLAVGHSITNGISTPDYPKGTKFYIPALRKYFIVEDVCGDGSRPQDGPCHTGKDGNPWLDVWVGGEGVATNSVYACQNKITDTHLVIKNPASNYAVASGSIVSSSGTCAMLYTDNVITK
jgi:hypothetical protein